MDVSDSVYMAIVTVFFVVSLAGMALLGGPDQAAAAVNTTEQVIGDITGEPSQSVDPWHTVCLGTGCIPPIDTPQYVPVSEADWLEPGDQVVAVSLDGKEVAFPLHILVYHAVVNTWIGGVPVAVTYSPYSDVPAAFERMVDGRRLEFAHSGRLYNGNMVMADRSTGTRWSQFTGAALDGELGGADLTRIDAHIVRWGIWRENNPGGQVLSRHTGQFPPSHYLDQPYFAYHRSRDVPTGGGFDIHPKRVVHGIAVGDDAVAYRDAHLRAENLVEDRVGTVAVMVVQDERRDRFLAFNRTVGGNALSFTLVNGTLRDTATGSRWAWNGRAVTGPLAGTRLQPIDLTRSYWYTWKLFHPDTRLYRSRG
ncbi:MAG: DUF3179 domain-containing protein [Candidatus Nanohaloarchaea archaeon]|nr:DUF3179 domain-containing protein [Candidatus Nanohaloarchaea archaeon]